MDALQRLGIDGWSVLLYLVNYGILFFVLNKFAFQPLAKAMEERANTIKNNLDEAERLKRDFQSGMEERAKENEAFIKSMQLELVRTRADADAKANALVAEAEAKREELIAQAYVDVAAMKRRAISDVEKDLVQKIERIALTAMGSAASEREEVRERVGASWNEIKTTL